MIRYFIVIFAFIFNVFTGCAAISGHKDLVAQYNQDFLNPDCINLNDGYLKRIEKKDDIILSANQAASIARKCGDYKGSNELFDIAESAYKSDVDEKGIILKSGSEIGSALVNENVLDYEGFYYERVMTNIYKALNFMSLNDFDNARVEINRALERERRAKEMYKDELEKAKKQLDNSAGDANDQQADQRAKENNNATQNLLNQYINSMGEFAPLADFINPFTSYIAGVFFYLDKDMVKAADLMADAAKMQPNNAQIASDFNLIQKSTNLKRKKKAKQSKKPNTHIWVIYENGQTINRGEFRLNIPLFIFTERLPNVGIALTKLGYSTPSYEHIFVEQKPTVVVSDMDAVVKSEFKKQMPLRVTRAVTRAITKIGLQLGIISAGNEIAGDFGAFIGSITAGIYSMATNRADVRFWSSLPMRFEALRLDGISGKEISIKDEVGNLIKSVYIPENRNGIIYIKSLAKDQAVLYTIFR